LLLLPAFAAFASDPTPASLAATDSNDALVAGLQSPDVLTRATAARVAMLNRATPLLPQVRETLAHESDAIAAREEIRAVVLLGNPDDVAFASTQSAKWPAAMDDALADAIARRGTDAIDLYHVHLAKSRMTTRSDFLRQALWSHPELLSLTASRLLGWHDADGWSGLLSMAFDSAVAVPAGALAASVDMADADIRDTSIWYLVRGYAQDPAAIHDPLRAALLAPRAEAAADREDFGRELLRRMLGEERKDNDRWLKFLATDEADRLLQRESESVLQYLTDAEYRTRQNRCVVQSAECRMPEKRSGHPIPSQVVAEPAFILPSLLPAGLADAVMSDARCNDEWLGVGNVTVDGSGRVTKLDLNNVNTSGRCRRVAERILRLSLATPTSIRSASSGPVVMVKAAKARLCLNEPPADVPARLVRIGGEVKPPVVKRRVEPFFPQSARYAMSGRGTNVLVVVEAVITSEGCVRNMRLMRQAPFGEINGSALLALSQWTFVPAYLDGKPVDALFNLTINFRLN
jgi:hypothetical protein